MDEIELSIRAAWGRVKPKLVDDPAEYARRLLRRGAVDHPPRAWCLAVRASDTRLDRYCSDAPNPSRSHQLILDKPSLWKLCSPITLDPLGEPIMDVAAKLGTKRGGLLKARVKGIFRTRHIHGPGKPQPMLCADQPLDPSARDFAAPDPIWTWTATFLPCYLPDDHPPQMLTRVAYFAARDRRSYIDSSQLHPEHPLNDPVPSLSPSTSSGQGRSLKLPPPEPDSVWYKWKDGVYLGYDWRNPHAAAGYFKNEHRKAKSRAAQKTRRLSNPKPRTMSNSLRFRGWKWICPKCNKPVNVLYLPAPPMGLIERAECRGQRDELNPNQKSKIQNPVLSSTLRLRPEGSLSKGQKSQAFACKSCHRVRYTSGTQKSGWGQIISYLSGGLLYGNEVLRPDFFKPQRKCKYSPRLTREPSVRRPQIEKLLLAGREINEIAKMLHLSKGTILFYSKQIYQQHDVKCLRDLLIKHGLPLRPGMRGPSRGKRGEGRYPRARKPTNKTRGPSDAPLTIENAHLPN